MVSDTQRDKIQASQAAMLRKQADDLLSRLLASREESERRLAELGRRDPMKFITGRTALDNAIVDAQQMIAKMDSLIECDDADFQTEPLTTVLAQNWAMARKGSARLVART